MKRRIFISGASRGIGRAIAAELDDKENEILACARSRKELKELKSSIQNAALNYLVLDLTKEDDIVALLAYFDQNGYPEVVIANMNHIRPYQQLEKYNGHLDFFKDVDAHLKYLLKLISPCLEIQRAKGYGRWIGISSVISRMGGLKGQAYYLIQKRMLESILDILALESGHEGITSNVIQIGLISTSRIKENKNFKDLEKMNLIGRAGKVEEVAHLVRFLISEKAAYLTGEHIALDGGSVKYHPVK